MIDTSSFEYEDSRWKDLFNFLSSSGYLVYAPGQHVGEAKEKYIVCKFYGTNDVTSVSSIADLYQLMCYVPLDSYSELDGFVNEVRTKMKEIYPLFISYDQQQALYQFDIEANAHFVTLTYKNVKKN